MAEQPNQITPEQTKAIAEALDRSANSPDEPLTYITDWRFSVHPGGLPGLLVVELPDGSKKKLRLVLEDMPTFGTATQIGDLTNW